MLSDAEKQREISNQLALLPYFGGDMSKHILVEVGPYGNEQDAEVTALRYRIISDLKHQPGVSDKIFEALTKAAHKLGISVVASF
ncbi:hypothetical protein [Puia dinghuensis]|uniref:Uncharacterized protein n=1 Tax=Puia dinghuensis TaxID=1792502 RepID=A0A8J2UGU8_9BACT|nr:hypothetical protein [Puia dinghuensis]GGB15987.1 hypothetical protein GCM10011511_44800 [Puia dinghuensis]